MKLSAKKDKDGELYFVDEWGCEYHRVKGKINTEEEPKSTQFGLFPVKDDFGRTTKYVYRGDLPRMDTKPKKAYN